MKKNLQIIVVFLILIPAFTFAQVRENCFECAGNQATGYKSMATGLGNTVLGDYSAAFGQNNIITGTHAYAFGENSETSGNHALAFGYDCHATEKYAFALGKNAIANQIYAFSLGKYSESSGAASFALGTYLKANNQYSMVIGKGYGYSFRLQNDIENSLMIGFNSTLPTVFVSPAPDDEKTGRFGIGNITAPTAKLHIKADDDEDAAIMLQATSDDYSARIFLGDADHSISAKTGSDLVFTTQSGQHTIFENGNVGFGTNQPAAKVQIKDGDIFIEDINRGIIMKSPDGNCWRGTVNNQGMLEFEQTDCESLETSIQPSESPEPGGIRIYPNPAGQRVFINCEKDYKSLQLDISNINGQHISSQKLSNAESYIDLSGYQPGTYIFRITHENGKQVGMQKVIKE